MKKVLLVLGAVLGAALGAWMLARLFTILIGAYLKAYNGLSAGLEKGLFVGWLLALVACVLVYFVYGKRDTYPAAVLRTGLSWLLFLLILCENSAFSYGLYMYVLNRNHSMNILALAVAVCCFGLILVLSSKGMGVMMERLFVKADYPS